MSFFSPSRKNKKGGSLRQERSLEQDLEGARRTPASGALRIKGDLQSKHELIEAKTTSKTQYTLKLEDLKKLEDQAREAGKNPVFIINLDNASEDFMSNDWVLIPQRDYAHLRQLLAIAQRLAAFDEAHAGGEDND